MKSKRYYTSSCLLPYRNGGWRGRLKFKKQDGTYGQVSKVMATKSKRAAQAELREWREEMEDLAQKKLKLGSMAHKTVKDLLDGYIDMLSASGSIESSTVYDYRGAARLVERRIGGIEFDSLDVTAAQNWINWAVEEGYKPSTIRKSVTLLKAAYRDAVGRLRVIDYSPVDCVRVPKAHHREPNALDERERGRLLTFLSIARDCPENVGIYLALLTGMPEVICSHSGGATSILGKRCCTSRHLSASGRTGITRKSRKTAEAAGASPCRMKSRGSLHAA